MSASVVLIFLLLITTSQCWLAPVSSMGCCPKLGTSFPEGFPDDIFTPKQVGRLHACHLSTYKTESEDNLGYILARFCLPQSACRVGTGVESYE